MAIIGELPLNVDGITGELRPKRSCAECGNALSQTDWTVMDQYPDIEQTRCGACGKHNFYSCLIAPPKIHVWHSLIEGQDPVMVFEPCSGVVPGSARKLDGAPVEVVRVTVTCTVCHGDWSLTHDPCPGCGALAFPPEPTADEISAGADRCLMAWSTDCAHLDQRIAAARAEHTTELGTDYDYPNHPAAWANETWEEP